MDSEPLDVDPDSGDAPIYCNPQHTEVTTSDNIFEPVTPTSSLSECSSSGPPLSQSRIPVHIPVELYRLIVQHVTRTDVLFNLCNVSRAFYYEAERLLYQTICLPNNIHHILSWCKVIVENPRLAIQVQSLSLAIAYTQDEQLSTTEELQIMIKRALSSLSGLKELYTHWSPGTIYLHPTIFCGHSFQLRVFVDKLGDLEPYTLNDWLVFLSEQPGIRHWRSNIYSSAEALQANVLPLLTSAHVHSPALNLITSCPMIRALRVDEWPSPGFLDELAGLKVLRRTLTSLRLRVLSHNINQPHWTPFIVSTIREAVPNLTFLSLEPRPILFLPSYAEAFANFLAEISRFPHLIALVFELPRSSAYFKGPDEDQALVLAKLIMNANASLKHVAFEVRHSWTGGRWPCYSRGDLEGWDSCGESIAVFEGFNFFGPESYMDF